jgi:UDP-N-acetyl-D-galactosamine dehydrogenase
MPASPPSLDTARIGVIGLGYVGLPVAVAMGRHFETVGFDIDTARVAELRAGRDRTREVTPEALAAAEHLRLSNDEAALRACNVYVITVPTPIDRFKNPDLGPLLGATETVGRVLADGDVVVYESTVYPGATEEVCVPRLEAISGLCYHSGPDTPNRPGFFVGYSPERINPGDAEHRLETIQKVTAGSTPESARFVDALYGTIITAGTHRCEDIRTAEAAKVIENTQRDVNIALINELAILFNRLGLDTEAVLKAAGTKWNFLPFRPGLVGGHCIGVDPYYLTHKAQEVGLHPEMILAGRRINDHMGTYVANEVARLMTRRRIPLIDARVLVLGASFKENCPDLRNTRVGDILAELADCHMHLEVYDPWVDPEEAAHALSHPVRTAEPEPGVYDAIIIAVGHRIFRDWGPEGIRALGRPNGIVYDVKKILPRESVDGRL